MSSIYILETRVLWVTKNKDEEEDKEKEAEGGAAPVAQEEY